MADPRSEHVLHLQQQAGNAAVAEQVRQGRVPVARQTAAGTEAAADQTTDAAGDADDRPLDAAQVRAAIAYHNARPWDYPGAVIGQIQDQVGAPITGRVDADTVQAIARWQAQRPTIPGTEIAALTVDGIAGPRTLGIMFPFGLAEAEAAATFSTAAGRTREEWEELTPQQRLDQLAEAVGDLLEARGVPLPTFVQADTNSRGSFDYTLWRINVNRSLLEVDAPSRADIESLAETVYHEARHCEQFFEMARMRAGEGETARAIAQEMEIPARIATEARQRPLDQDSVQAALAGGWYEEYYGRGRDETHRIYDAAREAYREREAARERFEDEPSEENSEALQEAEQAYVDARAEYRAISIELDAHYVHYQLGLPPHVELLTDEATSGDETTTEQGAP